jgi:hypothetical protein
VGLSGAFCARRCGSPAHLTCSLKRHGRAIEVTAAAEGWT